MLAKESEPSFRFSVTPAVCAPQDLLVVYPWVLTNVISGSPRLFQPYIVNASYAATYRNYHWEYVKVARGEWGSGITLSTVTRNYPTKPEEIADKPLSEDASHYPHKP